MTWLGLMWQVEKSGDRMLYEWMNEVARTYLANIIRRMTA